ncbi:LptF/LptG family permease [Acetobacter lambici]|uniref:LptF/LptG family permease n=2 Tax=Acetobacter lambici TaxID=1332824 RepID=A0ABT1EXF7_9PROT|nr:LptF/LptG family permease [Acetobacter lambici]MCP1257627.1 LptF/LptG family permease [Acetobacter lambici]
MLNAPAIRRIIQRFRPTTLDRYLINQVIPPFTIALAVVMTALLLERLLVLFNLLAAGNNNLGTFVELLTTLLPHYLGLAIPAALCVSVFAVMRRMSQNEEIDAANSSGLSLLRITRPYIQLGLGLGIVSFLLYGFIQPHARYDFRAAFYFASHTGWSPRLQPRMFARPSSDLTLVAEQVTQSGSELKNVFIHDTSDHLERNITARKGHIRIASDGGTVQLDLEDGIIVSDSGDKLPSLTTFQHSTRYLTHASQTAPFRVRGDDERELTSPELIRNLIRQDGSISQPHMWSELHFRLARSLTIPFIPLLATALAMARKRQRNNAGLPIAFILMIGFDHILQLGHSMVATKQLSVLIIWAPALVFIALCVTLLLYRSGTFLLWRAHRAQPTRTQSA